MTRYIDWPSDRWCITSPYLAWISLLVYRGWPSDINDFPLIIRSFDSETSICTNNSINPCLYCEFSVCCLVLNFIVKVGDHTAISIMRRAPIFVLFCRRCHIFLLFTHLHLRQPKREALHPIIIFVAILAELGFRWRIHSFLDWRWPSLAIAHLSWLICLFTSHILIRIAIHLI